MAEHWVVVMKYGGDLRTFNERLWRRVISKINKELQPLGLIDERDKDIRDWDDESDIRDEPYPHDVPMAHFWGVRVWGGPERLPRALR